VRPTPSPELAVLLGAARTHPDRAALTDLVGRDVDWEQLVAAAVEHGLVPLVHRALPAVPAGAVPEDALGRLAAEAKADAGRGLVLTAELQRLLHAFDGAGVRALPYKGPALSALAYGSVTARSYTDLDLVVEPDALPAVEQAMIAAGYQRVGSDADRARSRGHRWHHQYRREDNRAFVEIHWAFTYRSWGFARDLGPLMARGETVTVAGEDVATFAREDLVILLAVHGAKHFWERLLWVVDIARLAEPQVGVDWSRVVGEATRTGTRRMVLIALALARDLFGAPVPPAAVAAARADATADRLAARVRDRLLLGDTPRLTGVDASRFYIAMRERRREKLPYLLFPNDEDLSTVDLPPVLSPLYFAVRPFKLVTKYGRRLRSGEDAG
jgi:hypothetical protein